MKFEAPLILLAGQFLFVFKKICYTPLINTLSDTL